MTSNNLFESITKIVYSERDSDRVVVGQILSEDDYFFSIKKLKDDRIIRLAKNSIIAIKPFYGGVR